MVFNFHVITSIGHKSCSLKEKVGRVTKMVSSLKSNIILSFDETEFSDTNQAKYEDDEDVSAKICKCWTKYHIIISSPKTKNIFSIYHISQ